MRFLFPVAVVLLLSGCAAAYGSSSAQPGTREEFAANFTNISNVGVTGATPVIIRITRWTTDAEHQQLMTVLAQKETEGFVRELREMETVGSIGVPQELAYPLLYARQAPLPEGGRKIMLASDRPMSFEERVSSSISRDYPVTWIELTLDKEGRGNGTMVLAARLRLLGNILGIEDLGQQPARLRDVRKTR